MIENVQQEQMTRWPPDPTWENAKRIVGNSLDCWDRWCPDDGRVKAHFDTVVAYMTAATSDDIRWIDVVMSASGCKYARDMAWAAFDKLPLGKSGKPQVFTAEYMAYCVAAAVYKLSIPIVSRPAHDELHYKDAIMKAGWANLVAFMIYPDLIEDEDNGKEATETP